MRVKAYAILATRKVDGQIFAVNGFSSKFAKAPFSETHVNIYTDNSKSRNRNRCKLKSKFKYVRTEAQKYEAYQHNRMFGALNKGLQKLREEYPEYDIFISRINSKKCPIKVYWQEAYEELKYARFKKPKSMGYSEFSLAGQKIKFRFTVR